MLSVLDAKAAVARAMLFLHAFVEVQNRVVRFVADGVDGDLQACSIGVFDIARTSVSGRDSSALGIPLVFGASR